MSLQYSQTINCIFQQPSGQKLLLPSGRFQGKFIKSTIHIFWFENFLTFSFFATFRSAWQKDKTALTTSWHLHIHYALNYMKQGRRQMVTNQRFVLSLWLTNSDTLLYEETLLFAWKDIACAKESNTKFWQHGVQYRPKHTRVADDYLYSPTENGQEFCTPPISNDNTYGHIFRKNFSQKKFLHEIMREKNM